MNYTLLYYGKDEILWGYVSPIAASTKILGVNGKINLSIRNSQEGIIPIKHWVFSNNLLEINFILL